MSLKQYIKNLFGHLKNIIVHKYWVFYYARKFGVTWRGIVHDLSKFHPTEFFESVKYFQGDSSPIPAAKSEMGVSYAWQHHKGKNDHHYEHWTDCYDDCIKSGCIRVIAMPYDCMIEMLADWCAAGKTYNKSKFTYKNELEWIKNKLRNIGAAIHPITKEYILIHMTLLAEPVDDVIMPYDKMMRLHYKDYKKSYEKQIAAFGKKQEELCNSFTGGAIYNPVSKSGLSCDYGIENIAKK